MAERQKYVKKLLRSREDRYLAGIAGGLAEYFSIDSNLFRILFIIFSFFGGIGILIYIAAWMLVPENDDQEDLPRKQAPRDSTFLIAIILIVAGLILFTKEFGIFHYFHYWHIPWASIWAISLILIGILLVITSNRKPKSEGNKATMANSIPDLKKIYRSRDNRIIAGVCGGLGEYFNIDPVIIRLIWIFASFASVGLGILVYAVLVFIFPDETIREKGG
jgi:phage shock protein PspC (stress-responsive transcriptional regulator)